MNTAVTWYIKNSTYQWAKGRLKNFQVNLNPYKLTPGLVTCCTFATTYFCITRYVNLLLILPGNIFTVFFCVMTCLWFVIFSEHHSSFLLWIQITKDSRICNLFRITEHKIVPAPTDYCSTLLAEIMSIKIDFERMRYEY